MLRRSNNERDLILGWWRWTLQPERTFFNFIRPNKLFIENIFVRLHTMGTTTATTIAIHQSTSAVFAAPGTAATADGAEAATRRAVNPSNMKIVKQFLSRPLEKFYWIISKKLYKAAICYSVCYRLTNLQNSLTSHHHQRPTSDQALVFIERPKLVHTVCHHPWDSGRAPSVWQGHPAPAPQMQLASSLFVVQPGTSTGME